MLLTIAALIVAAVIALVAGFALSLRSAIDSKPPFTATVLPARGSQTLRVLVTPSAHARRVVIDSILISRGAVDYLGLLPPEGFLEADDTLIAFDDFEGDLSELTPEATDSEIDEVRGQQYTDYLESRATYQADFVSYRGRLPLSLREPAELLFPCRNVAPTTGDLTLMYNCRHGLLRQTASVTTSLELAGSVG